MSRCPECGQPEGECYRICPTQDPYGGDQAAEAADHDFNAQFDDVRERYMENCPRHGAYAGDCGGCEAEHADNDDIHDSFRPNDDGTVTYISPTGGEHTYDPDQVFKGADDDTIF